jgi:hypothetical protein
LIAAGLAAFAMLASPANSSGSSGNLSSRAKSLQRGISADSGQIRAYQGRLLDLRTRLAGIESSLAIEHALLIRLHSQLASARTRLTELKVQLGSDRRTLAAQLVAQYESPAPDIVGVAITARGFNNLLESVDQMKTLADHNAAIVRRVAAERVAVTALTARLTDDQARQQRVTTSVLVERDQVASIQLTVLDHERVVAGSRAKKQAQLQSVRHQLVVLQARAAAAQRASFALAAPAGAGFRGGAFAAHVGDYGFFPAPGTNYSVGQEPQLAARLDALGKALHLHLIGLSGYRSPQHSLEVGGFANDPHTRGEASDTPGVEGVPEGTLLQFGLTRPFGGAAEADHIQLA